MGSPEPEAPLLIVVVSGSRNYREYAFSSLARRYRVHLISATGPSWERPYLSGWSVVPELSTGIALDAARSVAAKAEVAGILCWNEASVRQAAAIADDLGLPGPGTAAVRRCRDKLLTRRALAAQGVPQPRFAAVRSVPEALGEARAIGYPVILKPRAASASWGVSLVHKDAELRSGFEFAAAARVLGGPVFPEPVLVEEFISGPEVSVDSVVHHGQVCPVFVARKETGFEPYFEETGHLVSNDDPILSDPSALDVIVRTHTALSYDMGWTHAEFKVTESGLKTIEVNARLGGDLIPYLGMRASGIDPTLAAADVACGHSPSIVAQYFRVAGIRFFYPECDDTAVESLCFEADRLPDQVDRAVVLTGPGNVVSPPPKGLLSGRIAFVTTVGADIEECRTVLSMSGRALRLRARPAAG